MKRKSARIDKMYLILEEDGGGGFVTKRMFLHDKKSAAEYIDAIDPIYRYLYRTVTLNCKVTDYPTEKAGKKKKRGA